MYWAIFALAVALTTPAWAGGLEAEEAFPGPVDETVIGDWLCGNEVRVFIARMGTIEVSGEEFTAGLINAREGTLRIEWDVDSERSDWVYRVVEGGIELDKPDGETLRCIPRG